MAICLKQFLFLKLNIARDFTCRYLDETENVTNVEHIVATPTPTDEPSASSPELEGVTEQESSVKQDVSLPVASKFNVIVRANVLNPNNNETDRNMYLNHCTFSRNATCLNI